MRLVSRLLLAFVLLSLGVPSFGAEAKKVWVCPMVQHTQEFDKPGTCPICGMTLVEKDKRFVVAVLVFNDAEDIDFTAPIEVLGHTGGQIFTVAETTAPITTVFGLHITPDFDLAHAPAANLILVPGGGVSSAMNDRVISWLRERAGTARYVMSVCNGAFILAKAGLLDGLTATTTAGRIDQLADEFPKIHVVRERVVDNGKVITTAGLSAGIDGALHVIERQFGRVRAEAIARGIEYRWQPDSKWTRSALADMRMPDIKLPSNAVWQEAFSRGDTQQWEMSGSLQVAMPADAFLDYATKQITAMGWTVRQSTTETRVLTKRDRDGSSWQTTLESRPVSGSVLTETMTVRRITTE